VGDLYTAYQKDATQEEVGSHSVETSIKNPRLVEFMVTLGVTIPRCSNSGGGFKYTTYRIIYSFINKIYIIKRKNDYCAVTNNINIFTYGVRSAYHPVMSKRYSNFKEVNNENPPVERAPICNLLAISLTNKTIKIEYAFNKTGVTEPEQIDLYKGAIAISPLIVY